MNEKFGPEFLRGGGAGLYITLQFLMKKTFLNSLEQVTCFFTFEFARF